MNNIILKADHDNASVWKVLQAVPGLSDTTIMKICSRFGFTRVTKFTTLNSLQIRRMQRYIANNFLTGYKLARHMTLAVTKRFISRSRRGIRSRHGLPINGQRTHSNAKTPRRLRGHWVLPEVLRNPIAYFITSKNEKQVPKVITQLIKNVTKMPDFTIRQPRKHIFTKKVSIKNKKYTSKKK